MKPVTSLPREKLDQYVKPFMCVVVEKTTRGRVLPLVPPQVFVSQYLGITAHNTQVSSHNTQVSFHSTQV